MIIILSTYLPILKQYTNQSSPFSSKNIQECRCGTPSCRGVLGPKPKDRELKEALKPLIKEGAKRKFQQAMQGTISASSNKKRKVMLPTSIKKAVNSAKASTEATKAAALSMTAELKSQLAKKAAERSMRQINRAKTKRTTVRLRSRATAKSTTSRASATVKSRATAGFTTTDEGTIKRNVVRTVRGANKGARVGKSIRVIDEQ
jgi:hypothetical protein